MKTSPSCSRIALVAALSLASGAVLLGGCFGNSKDRHPYVSRTFSPKTLVLVDTRTGDELWRYELGVGNSMKITFHDGDKGNIVMPDEMRWEVKSGQSGEIIEQDAMPCPPEGVRRIDWFERKTPEYPRPDAPRGEPAPLPDPVDSGESASPDDDDDEG
ncbi:MAG: hypothetical protein RIE32_01335 [Phycisphaerales bacterium]